MSNRNFILASLMSSTGNFRAPSAAMALRRTTPVVVSSLAALTVFRTSLRVVCAIAMRSAPSSMMKSGDMSRTLFRLR